MWYSRTSAFSAVLNGLYNACLRWWCGCRVDPTEDGKGGAGRRAAAEVFPRESKKALLESAKEKGLVKDSRFVRESEVCSW